MLVEFYSGIESSTDKDSLKILVDYMSRHEQTMKDKLSQITLEQQKQVTEEWIKYDSEYATCKCFQDLDMNKMKAVDDVIRAGLKLNQCLINLYHQIAESTSLKEVKKLFYSLEVMEIAEEKKLARMIGM